MEKSNSAQLLVFIFLKTVSLEKLYFKVTQNSSTLKLKELFLSYFLYFLKNKKPTLFKFG